MMQMLHAGGFPILCDEIRKADDDNPRGYLEYEPVKYLRDDASWLGTARGKAVKIIHLLLMELPPTWSYQVIFLHRDLQEVLSSQASMLTRQGGKRPKISDDQLRQMFQVQLDKVTGWLHEQPHIQVCDVPYFDLISDPWRQAEKIQAFLSRDLDLTAMQQAVDPTLYRNRGSAPGH